MSKNLAFRLVIAIVLTAAVILTIQEATATYMLVRQAESIQLSERGVEADAARWEAVAKSHVRAKPAAESRVEPGKPRNQRSIDGEAARLNAIAESYLATTAGARYSERGLIADAIRWTAIAESYLANMAAQARQKAPVGGSNQRSQRSIEAEAARWNAIAEVYGKR